VSWWPWETWPLLVEVYGEWWLLCVEVNTVDKRAHFKSYFRVLCIKISY
jgi:hypothetical protein